MGFFDGPLAEFRLRLLEDGPSALVRNGRPILEAFVEAQTDAFWSGPPDKKPVPPNEVAAITSDLLEYIDHMPERLQKAFVIGLWVINRYSQRKPPKKPFVQLTIEQRRKLLNQGELARAAGDPPLIVWGDKPLLHLAVSSVAMLSRLITNSRPAARTLVNVVWPADCAKAANHVQVPAPPYPDVASEHYDVCIVGSGAGGAIVAASLAAAGHSVLIVEEGDWISPHQFPDPRAPGDTWPPRDDRTLIRAFKYAGANTAGSLASERRDLSEDDFFRDRRIRPGQLLNFIQAQIVGGGPYVNNAIHFKIDPGVWNSWPARPEGITYAQLSARMDQIKNDLGVNANAAVNAKGIRTDKFIQGAALLGGGVQAYPMELNIVPQSYGCGADNVVCPVGQHIGGLHRMAPVRPRSYLMRALFDTHPNGPARIAYRLRAVKFVASGGEVKCLVADDTRGSAARRVYIQAKNFVVACGALASTQLLWASGIRPKGLGTRLSGNIITPVLAVFDKPLVSGPNQPDPGIAQCYYVPPDSDSPILENWFHFPGSLAIALSGWFSEYAAAIRPYSRLVSSGLVVPSQPRGTIACRLNWPPRPKLTISPAEFERLRQGLRRIGKIFLAAAQREGQGVKIHFGTKAPILRPNHLPLEVTNESTLDEALEVIRQRKAPFVNLATSHPQGGNPLGEVVDTNRTRRFRVKGIDNLFVADASLLPAGVEINPQLTIMALASYAADDIINHLRAKSERQHRNRRSGKSSI